MILIVTYLLIGRNLAELQTEAEKVGFKYQQIIVWDKRKRNPLSLLYECGRIRFNATKRSVQKT